MLWKQNFNLDLFKFCVFLNFQLVEGIFFLFSSVAECVDLDYNPYIPAVLNLLPKFSFTNVKFISSALSMIGRCPYITIFLLLLILPVKFSLNP